MIYLAERQGGSDFLRIIRAFPLFDAHAAWSRASELHRETKALGVSPFPFFIHLDGDAFANAPLRLSGDRVETVDGCVLVGRVIAREGRRGALVFRD